MKKILLVVFISVFSISVNAQKIQNTKKTSICGYDENKILKGNKFVCVKKISKITR